MGINLEKSKVQTCGHLSDLFCRPTLPVFLSFKVDLCLRTHFDLSNPSLSSVRLELPSMRSIFLKVSNLVPPFECCRMCGCLLKSTFALMFAQNRGNNLFACFAVSQQSSSMYELNQLYAFPFSILDRLYHHFLALSLDLYADRHNKFSLEFRNTIYLHILFIS
jgi:hypothetical protein